MLDFLSMADKFKQLVLQEDISSVCDMFHEAISMSFITNTVSNITKNEIKHRFDICDKIFTTLKGDLHWPLQKIQDFLPVYLKCELDGAPYNPERVGDRWGVDVIEKQHDVAPFPDFIKIDDDNADQG